MATKEKSLPTITKVNGTTSTNLPDDTNGLILLIKRIFQSSATITKSQHIDANSSSTIKPYVALWLDVFTLTVDDWLAHRDNPTYETSRIVKEIERWAFRNSYGMEMISVALYVAFKIEPEIFKVAFRNWLRANYPTPILPEKYALEVPFDTIAPIQEVHLDLTDSSEGST